MAIEKFSKILSSDPRFKRYQKPLEAAEICDAARQVSEDHYSVISFRGGLLTVGVASSFEAANLQTQIGEIIEKINGKIGESKVERVRFKISN